MQRSFIYSVVGVLSDGGAVSTVRHEESVSTVAQENWAFSYFNVKVSTVDLLYARHSLVE